LNTKSFNSDLKTQGFASGEFLIKLKHELKIDISKSLKGHVLTGLPSIDILNEKYDVCDFEQLFSFSESSIDNAYLSNTFKIIVPKDSDILSVVQDYSANPHVIFAEPNYFDHTCTIPNDANFSLQWAHQNIGQTGGMPKCDIETPDAWDEITGNEDIVIAIVDTGVDLDHPDLVANMWLNADEILDGSDSDGNGFIDDIYGWDFVNNDNDPIDDHGHGTCCAGIVGAVTDNNIGMAGICWDCRIIPVKSFGSDGYATVSDMANGITYAADNGADVISMSFGGSYHTPVINAIKYVYSQGAVLVAAAGNDHENDYFYPARCDEVIAVAATYYNDEKMWFSNWGSWVDVAAPGYEIYTVAPDDDYEICFGGTSGATPHVAGLVGLMLSKNPGLNQDEIKTILRSTTDKVRSNQYIGTGRINAYEAVMRDSTPIADLDYSLDDARVFGEIQINGTASGITFDNYIVSFGKGIYPEEWTEIITSSTPVTDDVLATWVPPYPADEMIYSIRLLVIDTVGQVSEDRVLIELNLPPLIPDINGKTSGSSGDDLEFTFVTTDPNKDRVHYYIEWGDGNIEDWVGSFPSGSVKTFNHTYNTNDNFLIRCKTKDVHDEESEWGTLEINIARNRATIGPVWLRFLDIFPILERILNYIL
jgi:subtilisin family serine protease